MRPRPRTAWRTSRPNCCGRRASGSSGWKATAWRHRRPGRRSPRFLKSLGCCPRSGVVDQMNVSRPHRHREHPPPHPQRLSRQGRGGPPADGSPPTCSATATTSSPPGCGGGLPTTAVRRRTTPEGKWQSDPWRRWATTASRRSSTPSALGAREFMVEGWTDRLATWRHDVTVKLEAGQPSTSRSRKGALSARGVRRPGRPGRPGPGPGRRRRACATPACRSTAGWPRPSTRCWWPSWPRCPTPPTWPSRDPRRCGWTGSGPQVGAWYELFPRSYGGLQGAAGRLPRRGGHGLRRRLPAARPPHRPQLPQGQEQHPDPRAGRPGQPVGHRHAEEGGHTALHPELGTFADFDDFVAGPGRWAWRSPSTTPCSAPRSIRGCDEHPEWFHHRPDGTIKYAENPPKKYQDIYPLNMWPAPGTSVPRTAEPTAGAVGRVQGHPRLLDRPRHPDLPGRQPPHQAVRLLGVGHRRDAGRASRRRLPGRGLHPAQADGPAGRGRLLAELHVLHLAQHQGGVHRVPDRAWPSAPRPTTCGRTSGPTPPTSSRGPLRRGGPGAFKLRLVLAAMHDPVVRHLLRLRAGARTNRHVARPTRSTSTPRSTRSRRATSSAGSLRPLHRRRQPDPAARTRPCRSCRNIQLPPHQQRVASWPGRRRPTSKTTWCWWWPTSTRSTPTTTCSASTSAALGLPTDEPYEAVRRADRRDLRVAGRPPLRAPDPGAARPRSAPALHAGLGRRS